jgi:hypothetical protein
MSSGNSLVELSNSAGLVSPAGGYPEGAIYGSGAVAIDSSGNAWSANSMDGTISKLSKTGSAYPGSPFSNASLNQPGFIAIDGAGNVWTSDIGNENSVEISELSNAGALISPATGFLYTGNSLAEASGIAVDGSGDVWVAANHTGNVVTATEFIGVATPVVTPLATGVKNNTLGTRP